ncbi:hypothetical protein ACH5RR_018953 [Cinchona calisaya]|uniref:F-box domain-containing protein n=1 Tax=Cinchona calisaya TaxID=153742 RepID=A0ABD2ZNU7_9GENT
MKQEGIDHEGNDDEWLFPQPIIQHILSYLSTNDAARMSLLSKTWCIAWSTHPILNLDLDDEAFSKVRGPRKNPEDTIVVDHVRAEFMNYLNKSLQRYHNQNVCIEQLNLSMNCFSSPDCQRD